MLLGRRGIHRRFYRLYAQHGARLVYALDVGHGQLHESLRFRPDVVNLEGMDIRDGEGSAKLSRRPLYNFARLMYPLFR